MNARSTHPVRTAVLTLGAPSTAFAPQAAARRMIIMRRSRDVRKTRTILKTVLVPRDIDWYTTSVMVRLMIINYTDY